MIEVGPKTVHIPTGKKLYVFDAAMKFKEAGEDTIVLAGAEYGSGSSRGWAAKGSMLLGVKAVIAKSFERIHPRNLVGLGLIILLCFKGRFQQHVSTSRRLVRSLWLRIAICSHDKSNSTYQMLLPSLPSKRNVDDRSRGPRESEGRVVVTRPTLDGMDYDDLVALKISLLGDHQIGKTSFLAKYVGDGKEQNGSEMKGLKLMDKTTLVRGARISYSIWEVEGEDRSQHHVPVACKDSVAILFMFDLTSRCTLNSVIRWYQQARRWNQSAIPIIVGTKFDDFVKLPIDLQWTIASQARAYARALNATLFFSSATYNINVNKIFKFITARLFDVPWTVERNLTIGEPIIDF